MHDNAASHTASTHFRLTTDITAPDNLVIGGTNETGWFRGNFNGNGHTVTVNINLPGQNNVGLFGRLNNGAVVRHLTVAGTVVGQRWAGGIAGGGYGTIENSYSSATVTGTSDVGGIIGGNSNMLRNSYATGNVTGTQGSVGGLVGTNSGTVENSYATGSVTGLNNVGGIIGDNAFISSIARNNVALNTAVIASQVGTPPIGRVVGVNERSGTVGTITNNLALAGMTIMTGGASGTPVTPTPDANGIHGGDAPAPLSAAFWQGLGFSDAVWDFTDPDRPTLRPPVP
jgi:hypothetical protein